MDTHEVAGAHMAALRVRQLRQDFQQARTARSLATAEVTGTSIPPLPGTVRTASHGQPLPLPRTEGQQQAPSAHAHAPYRSGSASGSGAPLPPAGPATNPRTVSSAPGSNASAATSPALSVIGPLGGNAEAGNARAHSGASSSGRDSGRGPTGRAPSPILYFAAPAGFAAEMPPRTRPRMSSGDGISGGWGPAGSHGSRGSSGEPHRGWWPQSGPAVAAQSQEVPSPSGWPGGVAQPAWPGGVGAGSSGRASRSGSSSATVEGAAAIRQEVDVLRQQWQQQQQGQREQWRLAHEQQQQREGRGGADSDDSDDRGEGEGQPQRSGRAAAPAAARVTGHLPSGRPPPRPPPQPGPVTAAFHTATTNSITNEEAQHNPALYSFGSGGSAGLAPGAASVSAFLAAIVTATGRRPLDPVITGSGRRPGPPPGSSRKPHYTADRALDSRLPIFVNATNLPLPLQQSRRRRAVSANPATATAISAAVKGTSSGVSSRVGSGVATSGTAAAAAGAVSAAGVELSAAGRGNRGPAAGAQDSEDVGGAVDVVDGAGGSVSGSQPQPSSRPSSTSSSRRAPMAAVGPSRAATGLDTGAAVGVGSGDGVGTAAAATDPWAGRLVYQLQRDVDVHLPDVNPTRPRAATAVMGRGRRGVEALPGAAATAAAADGRPALHVQDALINKRVPAASFATAAYKPRSPPAERRRRRAWDVPHRSRSRSPTSSPPPSAREAGESGPDAASHDAGLAGEVAASSRGYRRSRSRSAAPRQRAAGVGGDQAEGAGPSEWAPHERGQTTAVPLRSGPAVGFGRARRFTQSDGEDGEDITLGGGGRASRKGARGRSASRGRSEGAGSSRSRSRRQRRRWGEGAAVGERSAAESGGDHIQPSSPEAMAPLQLDTAYRAVLPRVSAAVISARSRRFDWLPGSDQTAQSRTAREEKTEQMQRARSGAAGVGQGGRAGGSRWRRRGRRRWAVREPGEGVSSGAEAGAAQSGGEASRSCSPRHRSACVGTSRSRSRSGISREGAGSNGVREQEEDGQPAGGRQRRRSSPQHSDEEAEAEPMEALAHLDSAIDAVRLRVHSTRFAHRSVAEEMRKELQARRERQLEKARVLQEQLRLQPVDQLWPAVAAQMRRERLQALGQRCRWSQQQPAERGSGKAQAEPHAAAVVGSPLGAEWWRQSTSASPPRLVAEGHTDELVASPGAMEEAVEGSAGGGGEGARASEGSRRSSPEAGVSPPAWSAAAATPPRVTFGTTAAVAATASGDEGGGGGVARLGSGAEQGTPPPPRPPLARGLFLTAMASPSPSAPRVASQVSVGTAVATPSFQPQAAAVVVVAPAAVATPTRVRRSLALSPERPPHFLAATQQTLSSLGLGPADPRASSAAGLSPSFALIEKRAPAAAFSPARSPAHPLPRYSREPGPGHYEPDLADGAISRHARAATPVFGSARRPVVPYVDGDGGPESPTHAQPSAAAEVAWLDRDPAAALDYTRRRAPAVVIAPVPMPSAGKGDGDGDGGEEEEDLGPEGARLILDVRYTLVEKRVQGMPRMRKPEVVVSDEDGVPLERIEPADPWDLDRATRWRRPAWGFPAIGHLDLAPVPVGRGLLDLRPVFDLVERRIQGVPDFTRTPDRDAGEEERARRLRRQPTALDYDVEVAWGYLCRRAPQVLMRVAAPRWPPEAPRDGVAGEGGADAFGLWSENDGGESDLLQRRQALLELSAAIDFIRPRPPAWTFAPLATVVKRGGEGAHGRGFGPLLSWDVNISLVRRRLPGALNFGAALPRQGLLDPRLLAAARHLAPGTYEVELAWRALQPLPRAADFAKAVGHELDADDPDGPDDGGDLPYGARLVLDVGAAKDAVMGRRDRGPGPQRMSLALGRVDAAATADPAYVGRTAHLPLPDPGLDEPTRPRLRNVVLEGAPGHLPPVPEPSLHEALRGPGIYYPAGTEQALAAVGPSARAVDFSRAPERGLLEDERPSVEEILEGNRLVLSPHTALDYVRPRPHVALIRPLVASHDPEPDAAFHAVYDVDPGLELVLKRPAGQPAFGEAAGRDLPMHHPAGIDPRPAPYGRQVGHGLAPEDVSLTALAGFRRAPAGPDFAAMIPRDPPHKANYDGQRLDLDPLAAGDLLRHQPPRPPNLGLLRGRTDGAPPHDWDLTAWLDYQPRLDAVRRHLVAPLAVPLGLQIGREQAARADPRVGDDAVGDLDAGVYRVRHGLVWRSAPAIDFGRGGDPRHTGLQPGALPVDPDAGNVLRLEPREAGGWQPAKHAGSPTRQPFGRGEGRWERPGADPAYRFLAAVGDEGGALKLRHSADDLAALRRRATVANAPATAWGWMTSRRDAQALQPDPARPPLPRAPPPVAPRGPTLLARELPPRNAELELIKANPPNDPRVVAIRRRDRVLQRMVARITAQRAAVADV